MIKSHNPSSLRSIQQLFENGDTNSILNAIKKYGYDNIKDQGNNTLLHLACSKGYVEIVNHLIKFGVNINAVNNFNRTPLHHAVIDKSQEFFIIANKLLSNNANFSLKDNAGDTPLHLAAFKGSTSIVDSLIKFGADIHSKNNNEKIPFNCSFNEDILQLLIHHGSNINFQDNFGNTTLHNMCLYNYVEIVQLLLLHNVNIDIQNKEGNTPLHQACKRTSTANEDDLNIIKLLISHNADMKIINKQAQTALDIAIELENTEIIPLIESYKNYNELNKSINGQQSCDSNKKLKL